MAIYKMKEIKEIIENTPVELKGKQDIHGKATGYFAPAGCNWAYNVEVINYNNRLIEIVKVFGAIKTKN